MKQQKSTSFGKLIPIFVQITKILKLELPMTWAFKKHGFQNAIGGKWVEVHRVYNKRVKVSELSLFSRT